MSEKQTTPNLSSKPVASDKWQSHDDVLERLENGEFKNIEDAVSAAKRIAIGRGEDPDDFNALNSIASSSPTDFQLAADVEFLGKLYSSKDSRELQYITSAFNIYAGGTRGMHVNQDASRSLMESRLHGYQMLGPVEPQDLVFDYQVPFTDSQLEEMNRIRESITHATFPPEEVRTLREIARDLKINPAKLQQVVDGLGKARLLSEDPDTGFYKLRYKARAGRPGFHYGKKNQGEILALYDQIEISPYFRTPYMQKKYEDTIIKQDIVNTSIKDEIFPGYAKRREFYKNVDDMPHDIALNGMRLYFTHSSKNTGRLPFLES